MIHTQATFAKLPTGELTVVLRFNNERRSATVGTRRLTNTNTYKIIHMFIDSLVFQQGTVEQDDQSKQPQWYNAWHCEGEDWMPFSEYYDYCTSTGVNV